MVCNNCTPQLLSPTGKPPLSFRQNKILNMSKAVKAKENKIMASIALKRATAEASL